MASRERSVNSRKRIVPWQRCSPSRRISSICLQIRAHSTVEGISKAAAVTCCVRRSSKMAATLSRSPASAREAASISLFVTPHIAETTTTRLLCREEDRMISTTRSMHSAFPTEVPPNFMIRRASVAFAQSPPGSRGRSGKLSEKTCGLFMAPSGSEPLLWPFPCNRTMREISLLAPPPALPFVFPNASMQATPYANS